MFSTLYLITGLAFVISVAAYVWFCLQLSLDIRDGRIAVKTEPEKK